MDESGRRISQQTFSCHRPRYAQRIECRTGCGADVVMSFNFAEDWLFGQSIRIALRDVAE
jgi:hypothetical protein